MKKLVVCLLAVFTLSLGGCLDIAQHYLLRPDGSLTVENDVRLDKSLIMMMSGMASAFKDSTKEDVSTEDIGKSMIDSLRSAFGEENFAHYKSLPQVQSVSAWDSTDDSTIHFHTSITLRSYKDLYLVAQDTLPGTGSMLPRDSALFVESGDTLYFTVRNRDAQEEPAPIVTKPKKKTKSKRTKKPVGGMEEVQDTSLASMAKMMGNLFSFSISVESPLLLGADKAASVDPAKHTATWTIDAANADAEMKSPTPKRAWFRKP